VNKRFAFWTGPCGVGYTANQLRDAGPFYEVVEGTERVYFKMTATWEQAAGAELLLAAQREVNLLFPHANYRVYEV
jgi:hypothetical protein